MHVDPLPRQSVQRAESLVEARLPVRVVRRARVARLVEQPQFIAGQRQFFRAEVGDELLGCAGTEDHGGDGRPGQQRGQRDRGAGRPSIGPRRVASAGFASRAYLPVSQPPPSGDYASTASPAAWDAGSISHSTSRVSRLYCGWIDVSGSQACS